MSILFGTSTFRFVRGATWTDTIQLTDDDGTAIDLTGVVDIVMRVRTAISSSTTIMELSVDNGRLTVDSPATAGIISLLVSAEDTLDFPAASNGRARYVYDAVIDRGGTPQVLEPAYKGKVVVEPQVTRILPEP